MIWIFVFLIGIFFLAPLAGLLSPFRIPVFLETVQDPAFMKSVYVTLMSSVAGGVASLVLALFFSKQFAHYSWRGKRLQSLLLLLPYLIPNFIIAAAFIMAWNPTTGLLNFIFKF